MSSASKNNGASRLSSEPFYPYQPVQKLPIGMMSRGFLPMPGTAAAEALAAAAPTPIAAPIPQESDIKLTKNQLKRMKKKAAAAAATPQAPSRLSLSGSGRPNEKWAVSSRGGECSPDCCCPMGVSCHDRIVPPDSADTVPEQEDESGFLSPKLTTPLSSKGDFENLD
jgi:hypothetical protein